MEVSAACFASSSLKHLQQQMGQLILSELSRRAWSGDDMLEPSTLTEYTSTWRRIFAFVADHIPNQKVCGAMTSFAGPLNRATVKNVWAAFCMTGGTTPTSWEVEYRNGEQIKKFEALLRWATRPRPIYAEVEAFKVAQNLRGVNYHGKTYDRDEAIDYVKAKEDAKKKTEEEKKKRALKKDQKNQDVAKNREKGDESVSGSAAWGAHEEAKKKADEEAEKKKAEEDLAKRKED
ncbi:hypothetical protein QIS74_00386 [Colletotrichum tabaci]|uniref:Uncharacterized protein n=1 Tax=Colletotrichum tabaci TaxID=1209068 RepID=A0AAV9TTG1_9PEZI